MICPNCGTDNEPDARFCATCGRNLTADPVADTAPEPASTAPRRGIDTGAAIRYGVSRAVLTLVIAALVGQGLAFLIYALNPGDLRTLDVVRIGGLFTYTFHHVGIRADVPEFELPQEAGPEIPPGLSFTLSITIAVALLLGTVLVAWLLYRAGRGVGARAGGSAWIRGGHALSLAVPYAALTLALSFAMRFHLPVPQSPLTPGGGTIDIGPSLAPAFIWPFVIAMVAGFLGAYRSAHAERVAERPVERWLRASVGGGLRMAGAGLIAAYLAFAVNAAAAPGLPREYFRAVARGDAAFIAVNVFLTPNVGGLVLPFAMGSSLGFEGAGTQFDLASLTRFPDSFDPTALDPSSVVGGQVPTDLVRTEPLPPAYFLYLAVPLVAVLMGGRTAARRVGARSRGEGAGAGAFAGIAFTVAMTLLVVLAGIGVRQEFSFFGVGTTMSYRIGASFWGSVFLAFLWGVGGGALGGLLARPVAVPAEPAGDMLPPPPPVPPPPVEEPPAPPSERPTERIPPPEAPSDRATERL